ncbi:LysR family transcriptional regulator [Paenibacillus sp. WLX2291]|uniref:LysR family transcriptional regulator n=1 Tax=Paenibacillus sp. WLX2291 TaxID=3296934 RepID=UPI003983FC38
MELLQLQYFVRVAHLEHMTEAAQSLYVTQSSLSRTIRRLEESVGVPLFDRIGKKLKLNAYGQAFLPRAEKALFELEQGRQKLLDMRHPEQSSIRLAVTNASTLPQILQTFREQYPHIPFHVQMCATDEMESLLEKGDVDIGLASLPIHRDTLEYEIVLNDPILIAIPNTHHLAQKRVNELSLNELAGESLIGVKRGYHTRDLVDQACTKAGFVPTYILEGNEPARLGAFIEAGIGIGFLPATGIQTADDFSSKVRLMPSQPPLMRQIVLVWRQETYISQAAQEFRRVVRGHFAKSAENQKNYENNS